MSIVTELKKLHKTIAGEDSTGNTIGEVLGDLDKNYDGPTGSSSSNEYVVNIGVSSEVENEGTEEEREVTTVTVTHDDEPVSISDIYAAKLAGKTVVGEADNVVAKIRLELAVYGENLIEFCGHIIEDEEDNGATVYHVAPFGVIGARDTINERDVWNLTSESEG